MKLRLARRACAELVGCALLSSAVFGASIVAGRSTGPLVTLLASTVMVGAVAVVLTFLLGPTSGAHLNPVVTLASAALGGMGWREVSVYLAAQVGGSLVGGFAVRALLGTASSAVPRTTLDPAPSAG